MDLPELSKAGAILNRAAMLVSGERDRTHGEKRANFDAIAVLWNAYFAIRPHPGPLTPLDIGHMMVLLKVARTQLGAYNPDDYVDMAGYSGCSGEIAAAENPEKVTS